MSELGDRTPRLLYFDHTTETFFISSETHTIDDSLSVMGYLEVSKGKPIKFGRGDRLSGRWSEVKRVHERQDVKYLRLFKGKLSEIGIYVD